MRLTERPWRVGELADHLCLDVSTVSRQVQALEEAGLARREPHPTDRRGSLVIIDEGGIVAVEAHRQARREIFAELLGDAPTTWDGDLGAAPAGRAHRHLQRRRSLTRSGRHLLCRA